MKSKLSIVPLLLFELISYGLFILSLVVFFDVAPYGGMGCLAWLILSVNMVLSCDSQNEVQIVSLRVLFFSVIGLLLLNGLRVRRVFFSMWSFSFCLLCFPAICLAFTFAKKCMRGDVLDLVIFPVLAAGWYYLHSLQSTMRPVAAALLLCMAVVRCIFIIGSWYRRKQGSEDGDKEKACAIARTDK